MSPTKFHLISPDCMDFLPVEAIELLEKATRSTPAPVLGPRDILMRVKSGIGNFYIVEREREIVGIFYIVFVTAQYGRAMNIVEFSAKKFPEWRDDAKAFLIGLLKESGAQNIVAIARHGFDRLVPDFLVPIGTLYEYRMTH